MTCQNDNLGPLRDDDVTGRLGSDLEAAPRERPSLITAAARRLVEAQFPMTVAPDVLSAVGLVPEYTPGLAPDVSDLVMRRRRSPAWRQASLDAWTAIAGSVGSTGS